jgi:hypothetical protein
MALFRRRGCPTHFALKMRGIITNLRPPWWLMCSCFMQAQKDDWDRQGCTVQSSKTRRLSSIWLSNPVRNFLIFRWRYSITNERGSVMIQRVFDLMRTGRVWISTIGSSALALPSLSSLLQSNLPLTYKNSQEMVHVPAPIPSAQNHLTMMGSLHCIKAEFMQCCDEAQCTHSPVNVGLIVLRNTFWWLSQNLR